MTTVTTVKKFRVMSNGVRAMVIRESDKVPEGWEEARYELEPGVMFGQEARFRAALMGLGERFKPRKGQKTRTKRNARKSNPGAKSKA